MRSTPSRLLLLAEPLLIRRPLLETKDRREAGFDPIRIHACLGLDLAVAPVTVFLMFLHLPKIM